MVDQQALAGETSIENQFLIIMRYINHNYYLLLLLLLLLGKWLIMIPSIDSGFSAYKYTTLYISATTHQKICNNFINQIIIYTETHNHHLFWITWYLKPLHDLIYITALQLCSQGLVGLINTWALIWIKQKHAHYEQSLGLKKKHVFFPPLNKHT